MARAAGLLPDNRSAISGSLQNIKARRPGSPLRGVRDDKAIEPYSWLIFCWAFEKYCQPVQRVTMAASQIRA